MVPLTEKQISKLKDKSFIAPGLNAVVDRNIAANTKAVVKDGHLFIQENGRYLKLIKANAKDQEKFVETAEKLFKGKRGRYNVWVRFNNGRSNSAFSDEQALIEFIISIYEKYTPEWSAEGYGVDEIIEGFEVYEQPPGIKIKRKKPARKKTPVRRKKKPKNTVLKLVKKRFAAPKKKRSKGVKRGKKTTHRRH